MELSENYVIYSMQMKIILIFNRYVNYKFFPYIMKEIFLFFLCAIKIWLLYRKENFFMIFIKKYLQFLFVYGLICIGQLSIL